MRVMRQPALTFWRTQQVYGTPQASGPVPLQKWYWLTPQSIYSSPPQHENWEIKTAWRQFMKQGGSAQLKNKQTKTKVKAGADCVASDNQSEATVLKSFTEKIQSRFQLDLSQMMKDRHLWLPQPTPHPPPEVTSWSVFDASGCNGPKWYILSLWVWFLYVLC